MGCSDLREVLGMDCIATLFSSLSGLMTAVGQNRRFGHQSVDVGKAPMCGRLPVGKAFLHGAAGRLRPMMRRGAGLHADDTGADVQGLPADGPIISMFWAIAASLTLQDLLMLL